MDISQMSNTEAARILDALVGMVPTMQELVLTYGDELTEVRFLAALKGRGNEVDNPVHKFAPGYGGFHTSLNFVKVIYD